MWRSLVCFCFFFRTTTKSCCFHCFFHSNLFWSIDDDEYPRHPSMKTISSVTSLFSSVAYRDFFVFVVCMFAARGAFVVFTLNGNNKFVIAFVCH